MEYKNWNRTLWEIEINSLPDGLTAHQAAECLKRDYPITLIWLKRFHYEFPDQRGIALAKFQRQRRKVDPDKVDWTIKDAANGRTHGVSRERMRQIRKERGKKRIYG